MATPPSGLEPAPPFQPVAAFLAWVIPGGGHYFLGHTRRAVLIAAGVLGLFTAGLFIGGISGIDRRESFFWFLGQALTGPVTLAVDAVHQNRFKAHDPRAVDSIRSVAELRQAPRRAAFPDERRGTLIRDLADGSGGVRRVSVPVFVRADPAKGETPAPPYTKSLGRANELGTLFCTIAGFMNLICIIDAAWRRRAERRLPASTGRAALGGAA